jgi:hypothetical protein
MTQLIVSYLVTSQHGSPHGLRIFDDGKVEDYRISKKVKAADGTYQDQRVTPGWYPVVTFEAAQIKTVRQAVISSGLPDLPTHISGDKQQSTANREAEWQVAADGGLKTITIAPWPPGGATGQALFDLTRQLSDLVTKALSG